MSVRFCVSVSRRQRDFRRGSGRMFGLACIRGVYGQPAEWAAGYSHHLLHYSLCHRCCPFGWMEAWGMSLLSSLYSLAYSVNDKNVGYGE
jgi:hypothetical protein